MYICDAIKKLGICYLDKEVGVPWETKSVMFLGRNLAHIKPVLCTTGCSFAFDTFKIVIKSSFFVQNLRVMGHLKAKAWGFAISK